MADMMSNDNERKIPSESVLGDDRTDKNMEMVFIGIVVGVLITCAVVWVIMHGGTGISDIAPNVPGYGN